MQIKHDKEREAMEEKARKDAIEAEVEKKELQTLTSGIARGNAGGRGFHVPRSAFLAFWLPWLPRYRVLVLATKYLVPSTWYQVLGTKYLVPSTWY